MPVFVAPALAQAEVPRAANPETLAPVVVAPVDANLQVAQVADLAMFKGTIERMYKVEGKDPAQALAEYESFLTGRLPASVAGVRAAVKVSQMQQRLKDDESALEICDFYLKKYASEPASVLLSYQKADVLMRRKQLEDAYEVVEKTLPQVLAVGPEHFYETSDLLMQLAQFSFENDKENGQERAQTLYRDVEAIYVHWFERGTRSHVWDMLEKLQTKYQQVGDTQRAEELLPKAAKVLLEMPPMTNNGELADASLGAARWMIRQGDKKAAQELYAKIPGYGNGFVTQIAMLEQGRALLSVGDRVAAHKMLRELIAVADGKVKLATLESVVGDLRRQRDLKPEEKEYLLDAERALVEEQGWMRTPIRVQPDELRVGVEAQDSKPLFRRLKVYTYLNVPLEVKSENPFVKARILHIENWGVSPLSTPNMVVEREIIVEIAPEAIRQSQVENFATLILISPIMVGVEQQIFLKRVVNP